MNYDQIIKKLKSLSNPKAVEGMAKFGINAKKVYGVPIPNLRAMAKEIGKDHELAQKLWNSEFRETRILASMIDDPKLVTETQLDKWVKDFDSWEVCDQCCMNLFWLTPFAYDKAVEWSCRKEEFEKRAGFAMMAVLAWKDKDTANSKFEKLFAHLKKGAIDNRNFVKKAVNWALRQIGKRNKVLNKKAIAVAKETQKLDSKSAKWIASDALRELESKAVQRRLK